MSSTQALQQRSVHYHCCYPALFPGAFACFGVRNILNIGGRGASPYQRSRKLSFLWIIHSSQMFPATIGCQMDQSKLGTWGNTSLRKAWRSCFCVCLVSWETHIHHLSEHVKSKSSRNARKTRTKQEMACLQYKKYIYILFEYMTACLSVWTFPGLSCHFRDNFKSTKGLNYMIPWTININIYIIL